MMQQNHPEDFVIATGESHSVREFVEAAFNHINRKIAWKGSGLQEVAYEVDTGITRVTINPKYFRPAEVVSRKGSFLMFVCIYF